MKQIIFSLLAVILLTSCGGSQKITTKGEHYASLYNDMPLTLLVMPPINNTQDVEAKDLLYTSVSRPLAECGFYVISPQLGMDVLKAEGAYDAEEFIDKPLNKFHDLFGADAVVFSEIKKWKKRSVFAPKIQADVRYVIKSTKTNEILFDRECNATIDMRADNSNATFNGPLFQLIRLIGSIFTTAKTDNVVAARLANCIIFKDIPRGQYSPNHMKDKESAAGASNISATYKLKDVPLSNILFVGGGYTAEEK